jgi:hypothetical protein
MYLLASSPVCGSTRVPCHLYSARLTQPFSYSDFRTLTSPLLFLFQSIPEPAGQQGEYICQAQAKPLPFQDKEPALTVSTNSPHPLFSMSKIPRRDAVGRFAPHPPVDQETLQDDPTKLEQENFLNDDDNRLQCKTPPHIPTPRDSATPAPIIVTPAPAVIAPVPPGMDPMIWANNQAFILSLLPHLQSLVPQPPPLPPPPPPPHPKEADAQALTKFSGNEPAKLQDFLYECGLVFDAKPYTYSSDKSKIIYTIQNLSGNAKRHFRLDIEQGYHSNKVNTWSAFTQELEAVFGDPDREGLTADKILNLKMTDNQCLHWYTVAFKECANELGWSDSVLRRLYYHGLPNRIKDTWDTIRPPADLRTLIAEAQQSDLCHWERVDEKKKSSTSDKTPKSEKNDNCNSNKQNTCSNNNNSNNNSNNNNSASTPAKSSTSSSSQQKSKSSDKGKGKDLSNILSPDGKLLPEEKARREKLGLCSYCAEKHVTDTCPRKPTNSQSSQNDKPTSSSTSMPKPKGRVAQVASPSANESSTSGTPADKADF